MPSEITIEWPDGAKRYAAPETYTYRELSQIKNLTGYRGIEIGDALMVQDPDVIIAIAVVAAARAHDVVDVELLRDLNAGSIRLESDDEDPTQAAPVEAESGGEVEATPTTPEVGGTPV